MLISVIMGIYNDELRLKRSIESIINQTYKNWELIMCDDGSSDNTYNIAKYYADKYHNIILLRNDKNRGLNYTLNKCIKHASGEFIARQDSDDYSHLNRFQKQIDYLVNNPNCAFVSSYMTRFDESGDWGKNILQKQPNRFDFLKGTPFAHAPVIIRKEALLDVGCYTVDKKLLRVEDYHLWFKLYNKGYVGVNISESLYHYLDDETTVSKRKFKYRLNEAYVKFIGFKMLSIPIYKYHHVLTPIIKGLIPNYIYIKLHRQLRKRSKVIYE